MHRRVIRSLDSVLLCEYDLIDKASQLVSIRASRSATQMLAFRVNVLRTTESRTDENEAEAAFEATNKKHGEDRCSRKDAWTRTLASRIIFSMPIAVHAGSSDTRVKKQKWGSA